MLDDTCISLTEFYQQKTDLGVNKQYLGGHYYFLSFFVQRHFQDIFSMRIATFCFMHIVYLPFCLEMLGRWSHISNQCDLVFLGVLHLQLN